MSNQKLFNYLSQEANWSPLESNMHEIIDIVLEEEGFKWIPVSERLPDDADTVLATTKDGLVYHVIKHPSCFAIANDIIVDVLAWMPLPKPYDPTI